VIKELIHQYGAWLVFALVFLESIGLPLPGETILVSAAIFAGTTKGLPIALVLLSAVSGAILGSTIGFWIGDRFGYPLLLRYGCAAGPLPNFDKIKVLGTEMTIFCNWHTFARS
jgi:membrane protein DedA with SNARE-associated domain